MILIASGCSSSKTDENDENKGLAISNFQNGIGGEGDTASFDKQKFSYEFIISNEDKTEIKSDSIEIELTHWIKQNQIENELTEVTFEPATVVIKGFIISDTKGLSKREILNQEPFIDSIIVVTGAGEKIVLKNDFQ